MPAVVALERLPVPALAFDVHGGILFSNTAFADMLGYPREMLAKLTLGDLIHKTDDEAAARGLRQGADRLLMLRHHDGYVVHASMSTSELGQDDDVVFVVFRDRTEQMWLTAHADLHRLATLFAPEPRH
jgi:PAS domain S-box-containing protein